MLVRLRQILCNHHWAEDSMYDEDDKTLYKWRVCIKCNISEVDFDEQD